MLPFFIYQILASVKMAGVRGPLPLGWAAPGCDEWGLPTAPCDVHRLFGAHPSWCTFQHTQVASAPIFPPPPPVSPISWVGCPYSRHLLSKKKKLMKKLKACEICSDAELLDSIFYAPLVWQYSRARCSLSIPLFMCSSFFPLLSSLKKNHWFKTVH